MPRFVDNPDGTRRPGMPPDVGKVVNNTETLLNVYNALFLGKPLTTKFFTVYGEGVDTKVYEVPIGASVSEVLGIAGLDVENSGHLTVLDGGPYLHDMAIEELGTGDAYVRRMTNSLFLIPHGRQGKEYAEIETECPRGRHRLPGRRGLWRELASRRRSVEASHAARHRGRRGGVRTEDRRARRTRASPSASGRAWRVRSPPWRTVSSPSRAARYARKRPKRKPSRPWPAARNPGGRASLSRRPVRAAR